MSSNPSPADPAPASSSELHSQPDDRANSSMAAAGGCSEPVNLWADAPSMSTVRTRTGPFRPPTDSSKPMIAFVTGTRPGLSPPSSQQQRHAPSSLLRVLHLYKIAPLLAPALLLPPAAVQPAAVRRPPPPPLSIGVHSIITSARRRCRSVTASPVVWSIVVAMSSSPPPPAAAIAVSSPCRPAACLLLPAPPRRLLPGRPATHGLCPAA